MWMVQLKCYGFVDPPEPSHDCGYRPGDWARNWDGEITHREKCGESSKLTSFATVLAGGVGVGCR